MHKTSVMFYTMASFEKQLISHKQKKPFVYFDNELTEAVNSSFCISRKRSKIKKKKHRMIFTMQKQASMQKIGLILQNLHFGQKSN